MKNLFFIILFFTVKIAGFSIGNYSSLAVLPGDSTLHIPSTPDLLKELHFVANSAATIELKEDNIPNLEACIAHHKKLIRYNPDFIKQINDASGDKWATMTLLAHEMGHHQKGHTTKKRRSNLKLELEADEYAGLLLFKAGATLEQAQSVMNLIAGPHASRTHPSRTARKEAIKTGWMKGTVVAKF